MGGRQRRAGRRLSGPGVLGAIALLSAVMSALGFAVVSPPAQSTPDYMNAFNSKYGTTGSKLDSCLTCHESQAAAKDNLNPYGTDFAGANYDFAPIEGKDSDGDGVINIDEINKGTFPGDPDDK